MTYIELQIKEGDSNLSKIFFVLWYQYFLKWFGEKVYYFCQTVSCGHIIIFLKIKYILKYHGQYHHTLLKICNLMYDIVEGKKNFIFFKVTQWNSNSFRAGHRFHLIFFLHWFHWIRCNIVAACISKVIFDIIFCLNMIYKFGGVFYRHTTSIPCEKNSFIHFLDHVVVSCKADVEEILMPS
jgi:hypothetical protein